jgi:rSAM/selenodomain-associated transferase 1
MGPENAARVYQALVHVLIRQLNGLEDCQLRFCYAPDDADEAIRFWILPHLLDHPELRFDPAHIDFQPQGDGDLGDRLSRSFENGFAEGFAKIAVIGSDCIDISSRWVHAAFAQLNTKHQAAVGPTPDGGYHLLALQTPQPELFRDIPWSTPETLPTTLDRARENGLSIYQLPPLTDIDTEGDYKKALLGPLGPALRKAVKELN